MHYDLGRGFASTCLIVVGRTFFAWLGVAARWLVGLDEGWGIAMLLFEFGNPPECGRELVLQLDNRGVEASILGPQFGILGPQVGDLVFKRHSPEYITL
jgi:hypothetical protein